MRTKNNISLYFIIIFIAMVIFCPVFAQQNDTLYIRRSERGQIEFARFAVNEKSSRKFKNDTIFLKSVLKAANDDEFRLKGETVDELGIVHRRYQQYYKGIRVYDAEYLLHGKNGNIEVMNGDYCNINAQTINPIFNEEQALKNALVYTGAERYKWEDPVSEKFFKQHKNDINATHYPKGELVFAKDLISEKKDFRLSWKFIISSLQPDKEQLIFVDALNGNIISDISLKIDANTNGYAQTKYSGLQNITCGSYLNKYRLYEVKNIAASKSVIINTRNCPTGFPTSVEFENTNTNWVSANWADFTKYQAALDAQWGAEKVLDYWKTIHSRNSLDGNGLNITAYIFYNHNNAPKNNASWNATYNVIEYGVGDGMSYSPWTSLDIIAHEMGHGIAQFVCGLSNWGEPGALNEGFCDIWGACVKKFCGTQ